jgi:hypothetical protein
MSSSCLYMSRRVDCDLVGAEYFDVGAAEVAECDGGGEAGMYVRPVDCDLVGAEYFDIGAAEVAECDGRGEAGTVEKRVETDMPDL